MTITCYDGKTVELPENFNAPKGSVGHYFANEFLPRYNSDDAKKFMNGAKVSLDRDQENRRLNWGIRVFELRPGDPTPKDFSIFGHSDRGRPTVDPL